MAENLDVAGLGTSCVPGCAVTLGVVPIHKTAKLLLVAASASPVVRHEENAARYRQPFPKVPLSNVNVESEMDPDTAYVFVLELAIGLKLAVRP